MQDEVVHRRTTRKLVTRKLATRPERIFVGETEHEKAMSMPPTDPPATDPPVTAPPVSTPNPTPMPSKTAKTPAPTDEDDTPRVSVEQDISIELCSYASQCMKFLICTYLMFISI